MDIGEMHVWFRQYAQQMGMQNVRAILPEQIDILINTSITDTVNQIIRENVGVTNDRIITDNSKIGQINSLKSLYKVEELEFRLSENQKYIANYVIDLGSNTLTNGDTVFVYYIDNDNNHHNDNTDGTTISGTTASALVTAIQTQLRDVFDYTSSATLVTSSSEANGALLNLNIVSTDNVKNVYVEIIHDGNAISIEKYQDVVRSKTNTVFEFKNENYYSGLIKCYSDVVNDSLFLVDFSVNYKHSTSGIRTNINPTYDNTFTSNWFPIRLIDDAYLSDTLNDFILKPRLRSPIMVIYNNIIDIYFGKFNGNATTGWTLDNNLVPATLRASYIAKPAVVKYNEDINGENVNCDLPEYMHYDILKHAVDLYRQALTGNVLSQQEQERQAQQEAVRNNYRNEQNG